MKISSLPIISSILFFTMLSKSCHGNPQYWNRTHERCQRFKDPSLEKIDCPSNFIVVEANNYPGELICECPPYNIYFPDSDSCHEVYKRGPCPEQHYVTIEFDETEPSCVKNPCEEEGQVLFDGSCHKLGDSQPCPDGLYLNVNLNNFRLECSHFQDKQIDVDHDFNYYCARGSVRVKCEMCIRIVG